MKRLAPVIALLSLAGCASYHVQRGAAIGALSGAALGALTGEIISDPNVLGSHDSDRRGRKSLPQGDTILVSLGIGVVVGGIVGAMVGHQRDDGFEGKPPVPVPPPTATGDSQPSTAQLPGGVTPALRAKL
jgi:hypothetical protein